MKSTMLPASPETLDQKLERLRLLERRQEVQRDLPHLYGLKMYAWQREFFESMNRNCLLTAANQVGKSTIQIRRIIHRATEKSLWPKLWATEPRVFWYLYPSKDVATIEFEKKWVPDFLPRGKFKDDPKFGWKEEYERSKFIYAIHFNSGVSLYFKTYAQDVSNLQTGTVHDIGCFTAGHAIETIHGSRPIETIKPGDLVLTRSGYMPVAHTMVQPRPVITRTFSNGTSLEGTADHPILTLNRGWTPLSDLTEGDICVNRSKWFCSRANFILAEWIVKTIGLAITSVVMAVSSITSFFGKGSMELPCLKAAWSTIKTSIRSIIPLKTFRCCREQNTQDSTSLKSGSQRASTSSHVKIAESNLSLAARRTERRDSVRRDAEGRSSRLLASIVAKLNKLGLISSLVSVQSSAQTEANGSKPVYNMKVLGCPEYFCNGILVHNCDEELPVDLYDEVNMRRQATDGYFSNVFTATLSQDFWRRAMEVTGPEEVMPDAWKRQISIFDCMFYEDGTPSMWTKERITRVINSCKSEAEVQRRVYGKFVKDSGLKYSSFAREHNVVKPYPIPKDWLIYAGIDIGSGGDRHPSAISFVAVRPDMQKGCVFKTWRGDGVVTTSADVVQKYIEMKEGLVMSGAFYDWHNRDFHTVATSMGIPVIPADKNHETGEGLINVLFKNQMLDILDTPDSRTLVYELQTLDVTTLKTKAKDDQIDSMRYAVTRIPWDMSAISGKEIAGPVKHRVYTADELRSQAFEEAIEVMTGGLDDEFEEWNGYLNT